MKNISKYEGIRTGDFIRLNSNESSRNLREDKINNILEKIKKAEFNRYPESENSILKDEYSKYIGVSPENIIAGNGSDEMIALVINSFITKGKKVLTLNPDFTMYDYYVGLNEGELLKVNCNKDGSYKIEDFKEVKEKKDISLLVFSNPNNPTGFALKNNDIFKLLKEFKDIPVLVDEAYSEFSDESIVSKVNEYENLLVTRTMSKGWGAAAIRVGFLIGNKEIIEKLNNNKVPYNVNSISQIIGSEILKDRESLNALVSEVKSERDYLLKEFKGVQMKSKGRVEFYPSKANYIFGRSKEKDSFIKLLEKKNIVIRNFKDDSFRITIGSKEENRILLNIIKRYFS